MKKYFALILSLIVILTCFTACKPRIKNGAVVENGAGEQVAVVTSPDGGIARDEAGNIIVLVTDENGKNVKDENGEYKTNAIAMDHAIVLGRRVEAKNYSVEIPDGWSDKLTSADLDIIRDGTKDNLRIAIVKDADMNKTLEQRTSVVNLAKNNYPTAESANKKIALENGIEAQYMYTWVDDTGVREDDGKGNLTVISSFIGFIVFEYKGDIYSCNLSSNQNMNEDIDEIIDILNTIEFIKK